MISDNKVSDHGHNHNGHKGLQEMGNVKLIKSSKTDSICILANDKEFQEKLENGNKAFK